MYAWAHLILYGEEATKKAQRGGEEAAAAYERKKAAIAAGEILPPPPKPEKKKKVPKKRGKKADDGSEEVGESKKRKSKEKSGGGSAKKGSRLLSDEYSQGGYNELFRCVIQGSICVIGRASKITEQACEAFGLGAPAIGGTAGDIDCHISGAQNSCSEYAALIQYLPSSHSDFQLVLNNDEDVVTLNGKRILVGMGSFPLFNKDICSVGSRVFVFLLPSMQ